MEENLERRAAIMRFRTAVVIGKFYPPHRGHKFLIDTAASQADHVTVIVCGKRSTTSPASFAVSGSERFIPMCQCS